ncbi:MAG: DNA polymerase III subunit delta [Phycisphaerales bacterium]|nr:DNA polymerase III subunit delta [Phycisphaerales bacterium]MDG2132771.1 DNA polymerase III subunit delta [Phycisphaerales bacterium]
MAKAPPKSFKFDPAFRVILLKGKESYLHAQYLKMIERGLEESQGEAAERFDFEGSTTDLATLLDELRSYGLMQSHKLVVLDNADAFVKRESHRRGLEAFVASAMDEATLVLRTTGDWRPGKLDKAILKVGAVVPCDPPSAATAISWCIGRAEKHHEATLGREAAGLLVERIGSSLARLDMEIAKLSTAAAGDPPVIDLELVRTMVEPSREEQGWMIQSVILGGDAGAVVRTFRALKEISRVPDQVLSWAMVDLCRKLHEGARQFEAGGTDSSIGKSLRLWGPDARPVLATARRMGGRRAARLLDQAVGTDLALKSGGAQDASRTLEGLAVVLADTCRVGSDRRSRN